MARKRSKPSSDLLRRLAQDDDADRDPFTAVQWRVFEALIAEAKDDATPHARRRWIRRKLDYIGVVPKGLPPWPKSHLDSLPKRPPRTKAGKVDSPTTRGNRYKTDAKLWAVVKRSGAKSQTEYVRWRTAQADASLPTYKTIQRRFDGHAGPHGDRRRPGESAWGAMLRLGRKAGAL